MAVTLAVLGMLEMVSPVRAAGLIPREIAITDEEAGREAALAVERDGQDERSVWVQLRWERDHDGPDFNTGPATIENVVWVAKDLASARAIYQEQAARNEELPEAFYEHHGPFALPIEGIGDEVSGISACVDCNAKDDILLHHRATFRRGVVVTTIYLYGSEATAPQSLMSWFAVQVAARVPDAAMQAPERAEELAMADAPAATPVPEPVGLILAEPQALAVRIGEAGTGANMDIHTHGKDARGTWYEVRYEREGSASRFYQGPVIVHNIVFVARDVEGARQTYQEQVDLNDEIPEADRRIGDTVPMREANTVGYEGAGVSACERSCDDASDAYVHKRLVSRVANVVSVVYLWGLAHEEGTSDRHARYFGDLVMTRARAAGSGPSI